MEILAIGERKVFTDVTLEVVFSPDGGCNGCWFQGQPSVCTSRQRHKIMGECAWISRYDGMDVIFKAVKGKED